MLCLNATVQQQVNESQYFNVLEDCFGGSRAAFYEHYTITGVIERVLPPLWLVVGIPGNILCAITWLNGQIRQTSAIYLGILGVNEAVLLSLTIVAYLDRVYELPTTRLPIWCQAFPVLFYFVQYLHPLLTLAYSAERWYSVWFPFKSEKGCTAKVTITVTIAMVLVCSAASLVQIRFYEYRSNACDVDAELADRETPAHWFYTRWTWTIETFLFGVVPVMVLTLNVSVILLVRRLSKSEVTSHVRRLSAFAGTLTTLQLAIVKSACPMSGQCKKKRQSHGQAVTTLTLLTMSFYFIIMSLPVSIATALYLNYEQGNLTLERGSSADTLWEDPVWRKHFLYITVRTIIDDVALSQHAVGFYIYFLTSRPFRRLNLRILARCVPRLRSILANERLRELKSLYAHEPMQVKRLRRFSAEPTMVAAGLNAKADCRIELGNSGSSGRVGLRPKTSNGRPLAKHVGRWNKFAYSHQLRVRRPLVLTPKLTSTPTPPKPENSRRFAAFVHNEANQLQRRASAPPGTLVSTVL